MCWRSGVVHAIGPHAVLIDCTGRAYCGHASQVGARHTIVAGCSNVYSSRGASATVVHDVLPGGAHTFLGLMVAERLCVLPPSLSVASLSCSDTSALVVVCGRKFSFYTHNILHNTPYTLTLTSFTYFRSFCCFQSSVIVSHVYSCESLEHQKPPEVSMYRLTLFRG